MLLEIVTTYIEHHPELDFMYKNIQVEGVCRKVCYGPQECKDCEKKTET